MDSPQDKSVKIREVFSALNRKFQEQEIQRRAEGLHLPYFNLINFPIDQTILAVMAREEAETAGVVPFAKDGPRLKIGAVEPMNPNLQRFLGDLEKKKYIVDLYLISPESLVSALGQYRKILTVNPSAKHEIELSIAPELYPKLQGLAQNAALLGTLSPSDLLNMIIGGAVVAEASDVHVEPESTVIKIRFRVDGVLQDIVDLPLFLRHQLMARIKLLSGLKLNITNVPQDGRFTVKLADKNLDLRVSALPSTYGETIVMRLLGIQNVGLDIEKLGLRGRALEAIYHQLQKPNGLILTTGPTGSGKTTTLYAFLSHVNRSGIKIITIEDPVEYRVEGIVQMPIDRAAGLDFAKALRSVLRQDPDILMVGEIRDFETAETAAQAALTGHVVFSTLHTNDAAGAIPRLLDLGLKPATLAPALSALVAQRLVRRICIHCKEVYRPAAAELQRVKLVLSQISAAAQVSIPDHLVFYHSPGCAECHNLGYHGRVGVFEVITADEKIQRLVFQQVSAMDVKRAAVAQGMLTMQQDGILKALEGVTDLAEVWRVTEE